MTNSFCCYSDVGKRIFFVEGRDGYGLDVEVDRVVVGRREEALRVEKGSRVCHIAQEDQLSLADQANVVEELDKLTGRLMNGEYDSLATLSQLAHALHNRDGHEAV